MISRRFKLAVGFGGAVGAALAGGFAPLVRHEATRVAQGYGAVVVIGRVAPTRHGIQLQDVDVTLEEVPAVRVHLDDVEVLYGSAGRRVVFHGGMVAVVGARDVVLQQADAWRSRHLAGGDVSSGAVSSGVGVDVSGLRLSWANSLIDPGEKVSASDLGILRKGGSIAISAGAVTASFGGMSFSVKDGHLELVRREGGGYRVGALTASEVDAQVVLPAGRATPVSDGAIGDHDSPASAPVSIAQKPRGARSGASRPTKIDAPRVSEPRAASNSGSALGSRVAYRAALLGAVRTVDMALEPNASVQLGGVHVRIRRGDDVLNLGPGVLELSRAGERMIVNLAADVRHVAPSPTGASADEALSFRLAVPLGQADDEIAADVNGGPIWLSSLGIHEGDFGLFDVGLASLSTRSHLVLTADGKTLRVDGEAKIHTLSLKSAALSDEPVAGLDLALRLNGELDLDGSRVHIAGGEVDLGAIQLVLKGDYERFGDAHRLHGTFDMPLTACQSIFDSTPGGLVSKLQGMRLAGSYSLRGRADLDTAHLDHGFALDWDAANTCRVIEAPAAISAARFRAPFRRTAYDPEGRPVSIETGPGSPDWVPLTAISKFMETAVLTTEDSGFRRHHGFDHEAIRNSVRENLRQRRFVRGASTISMQLAKNLYLDRSKNLARKLQEAVLTMYLEQELTKDQILELYFNVVEFGPLIYGIGPAARYYFDASARELSLGQALYIASIMPNPKVQHFGANGAVTPTWMSYLHKLMKLARDRDNITEEELDEGLRETVLRGSPAPLHSARPVTGPDPELPFDTPDDLPQ